MQSSQPRIGAVLILVYPRGGAPHVVFTERGQHLSRHSGQVSLPGGSREPDDVSLVYTALREAEEELGIPSSSVQVLGTLDEVYVQVSNFLITPVVGTIDFEPAFVPDPNEVAEVIEVPLERLSDPAILVEEDWELRGAIRRVPFYRHGRHQIWGATQRVIEEFLASDYLPILARGFIPHAKS